MQSRIVIHIPAHARELENLALKSILGVPLFLRTALTLADAGDRDFVIVAPARLRRPILKAWQHHMTRKGAQLHLIQLTEGNVLQEEQLADLRRTVAERFVIVDGLSVVTPKWVQETLLPALRYGRAAEPGIVLGRRDLAMAPRILQQMAEQPVRGVSHWRQFCRIVSTRDIHHLETFLCEYIRNSNYGWVAKNINKRISLPISRILSRLRVSPNSITAFNMLIGLAAGIGTAGKTYVGLLWGAIFFQLASILDGCDGEVAKLTHRTSKFGQFIDTLSDNFALASFFVGLTIHQFRVGPALPAAGWGLALFGGVGALLVIMVGYLRRNTDSLSLVTFDKEYLQPLARGRRTLVSRFVQHCKPLMKKEWFTMIFLAMAICGVLPAALYLGAIGSWIGVLALMSLRRQPKRAATPAVLPGAALSNGKKVNAVS